MVGCYSYMPVASDLPPAPSAIVELVKCGCGLSKCKTYTCSCHKHNLCCTELCVCEATDGACTNNAQEPVVTEDSSDDDNDDENN